MDIRGKVVLVTGGSSGIGRETALAFAREGARVALTYRTSQGSAEAVVGDARSLGADDAMAVAMALADPASIQAAVEAVEERLGGVDVLVNNAVLWGVSSPVDAPPFEESPDEAWVPVLRDNVEGHIRVTQRVVSGMKRRGWGRIVNVSSTVAEDGLAGVAAYGAAKAALHGLTRSLCVELGPAGILVNTVLPGLTLTERNQRWLERSPETAQRFADATPLKRLMAAADLASAIVFLGSAANRAITGETIRISGGG